MYDEDDEDDEDDVDDDRAKAEVKKIQLGHPSFGNKTYIPLYIYIYVLYNCD